MANVLKIKRSSVAGKLPLTTDLQLGELAINTTDGRLFTKKNVSATDYIVEFLSTDSAFKTNAVVATTANITLSATQTIDGVMVAVGDRVLVKDQSSAAQNGIYIVAAGAWTRAPDMDTAAKCAGAKVSVNSGTTNGGRCFDTDFKSTDTLGTTSMSWSRALDMGAVGVDVQAYDADLSAIAGLAGTSGFLKKTAANTWSLDTATYLTGNQTITLSGDISGSGATAITTAIGANKVTNAMLAQVATATFKGRTTAATGNVEDLTVTQATAMLNVFSSTLKGLAPASGGGTTNFLRADGTWAAPGVTAGVSSFSAGTTGLTPSTATTGAVTLAGTLGVANGGTGATTLTGLVKGNGTSAMTAAVAGTDYAGISNSNTFTANQTFGNGTAGIYVNANGAAGSDRAFVFKTAGSTRWTFNCNTAAESGSNAGSNFELYRHSDAGAYIDTVWSINRSTGVTNLKELTLGTDLAVAQGGTGVSTITGIVKGNGASAFSAAVAGTDYGAPAVVYPPYTSGSGNWTIPSGYTFALVRAWGAGGSGGCGVGTGCGSGGGGGAYKERLYKLSDLGTAGASIAYSVGAGGTGVTGTTAGNPGGNTTFASGGNLLTAYGGGGGGAYNLTAQFGTGGAYFNAGLTNADSGYGGSANTNGAKTIVPWGGSTGSSAGTATGGDALYGGAGGGSTNVSGAGTTAGGVSVFGGNGGAGPGGAGSAPGGGGGGNRNNTISGAGGAGRIEIYVW